MLQEQFAESFRFFIFEIIKIYALLLLITFAISWLRTFLPPKTIKKWLAHQNLYVALALTSLLGIVTPLCSCSAIPLFLGFLESGVPLGVAVSFLISSSVINIVALVLLLSLFSLRVAIIYIACGWLLSLLTGIIIDKLRMEKFVEPIAAAAPSNRVRIKFTWRQRIWKAWEHSLSIFRQIWAYILVGVGLGALIHGFVPIDFLSRYAGADNWLAVPIAILIAIPLYLNAAGMIPLIGPLVEKGMSVGTALAFLMAITAISLPEFMILKKLMHWKLLFIFAGIVTVGIIVFGYLLNSLALAGLLP